MDNNKEMNEYIIQAMEERNGDDIQVIDLNGLSVMADDFIIVSAGNERKVNAIAGHIEDKLAEQGFEPKRIEGKNNGRWVLMDYGDTIVHVFHEKDRSFYNLERLWKEDNNIRHIQD